MRIENYLGFPTGVTGSELADRAISRPTSSGPACPSPATVIRLELGERLLRPALDGGETVTTKCLLIATGADYRRLDVEGCARFEGRGVYYAATLAEGQMCRGAEVVVVGGGNSAGQAAVFLAQHARRVLLVIRGDNLYKSMSSYLARRIEQTANIEVLANTTVRRMLRRRAPRRGRGRQRDDAVTSARWRRPRSSASSGRTPRTDWLPPEIERDARGSSGPAPALATVSPLDQSAAAVPAGDQPPRRVRGR